MFQKTCKALGYMQIIVCEIPPAWGAKPYLSHGLYRLAVAAEGFRRQEAMSSYCNIFITVPVPTIIVRHWFVRINVRC